MAKIPEPHFEVWRRIPGGEDEMVDSGKAKKMEPVFMSEARDPDFEVVLVEFSAPGDSDFPAPFILARNNVQPATFTDEDFYDTAIDGAGPVDKEACAEAHEDGDWEGFWGADGDG